MSLPIVAPPLTAPDGIHEEQDCQTCAQPVKTVKETASSTRAEPQRQRRGRSVHGPTAEPRRDATTAHSASGEAAEPHWSGSGTLFERLQHFSGEQHSEEESNSNVEMDNEDMFNMRPSLWDRIVTGRGMPEEQREAADDQSDSAGVEQRLDAKEDSIAAAAGRLGLQDADSQLYLDTSRDDEYAWQSAGSRTTADSPGPQTAAQPADLQPGPGASPEQRHRRPGTRGGPGSNAYLRELAAASLMAAPSISTDGIEESDGLSVNVSTDRPPVAGGDACGATTWIS